MVSKTPLFDRAISEILDNLSSHKKTCKQCGGDFSILEDDIKMYQKLKVPTPSLCWECRKQRRFGFYNNVLKFYKKENSAKPGEKVISTFPSNSSYKIFDLHYWWSDKWGAEDYGRDYDFNQLFFEQFQKLNLNVPHPPMTHYYKGVIDSPYTISIIYSKNCYFTSLGGYIENVYYTYWIGESRDCLDSMSSIRCENCYNVEITGNSYNCKFLYKCDNCIDSVFLYHCDDCQSCFGCVNLRHKKYCFFNEQLTREEYKKKIDGINLGDGDVLSEYKSKFDEFVKRNIRKNIFSDPKNINCFGDDLWQAKNCYLVFRASNIENVRYSSDIAWNVKDSSDIYLAGPNVQLSYEDIEIYESSNIKFSYFIRDGMELEYCLECHSCQNCFGCVGLRNKKFHIFNKPYLESEYWKMVDKIKTVMLGKGEYGEFFALSTAYAPYNDTYAMIEFPMIKEEVLKNSWQWSEEESNPDLSGMQTIDAKDLLKDIKDVGDDILNKVIICGKTKKPFKLIKVELDFYRKHNLPLPTIHPNQRIIERLLSRNPARLYKIICAKCGEETYTSYSPEKQKEYKIYCEKCYQSEVV